MADLPQNRTPIPVGQIALREQLDLKVPEPHVQSYVSSRARRTVQSTDKTEEFYPASYYAGNTIRDHLRFTLRYEAFDLRVLAYAFERMDAGVIVERAQQFLELHTRTSNLHQGRTPNQHYKT